MTEELSKGNRVEFRDFGVFEVRQRQARVVRNPQNNEHLLVPASLTVRFKCGRAMRRAIEHNLASDQRSSNSQKVPSIDICVPVK